MATKPWISVIVPVYRESRLIAGCLRQFDGFPGVEKVVVVNGPDDGATAILDERQKSDPMLRVCHSQPGRATAMNHGARQAQGDVFLFLHCDCILPECGIERIREAMQTGAVGGFFRIRHDCHMPSYRLLSPLINYRSKTTTVPFGDQGVFLPRVVFERLGGYREMPILDDYEFARRLVQQGPLFIVEEPLITSARRFEKDGVLRYMLKCNVVMFLYRLRELGMPISLNMLRNIYG